MAAAARLQRLQLVREELASVVEPVETTSADVVSTSSTTLDALDALIEEAQGDLPEPVRHQLEGWPAVVESYSGDEQVVRVRAREIHTKLTKESLSGNKIRREIGRAHV